MVKIALQIFVLMLLTQSLKSGYNTNHVDINKFIICNNIYKQKCSNCFTSIKKQIRDKTKKLNAPISKTALDNISENLELIKKISSENNLPYGGIVYLWFRESNWGTSYGARKDNVHFGVKCHGKSGVMYKDDCGSKKCCFVSYPNFESSLRDLIVFFKTHKRYTKAGLFEAKTAEDFIKSLKKASYATDPLFLERFYTEFYKYKINEL